MEFTAEEIKKRQLKSNVALMWFGIVSIVMLFAGLTSAYIVRRGEGNWQDFEVPTQFYYSTAVILMSSLTFIQAINALKKNDVKRFKLLMLATLLFAISFVFTQFSGYAALVKMGIYLVGNASGAYMYALTGMHLAHLIGGVISIIFIIIKSLLNKYSSENWHGVYVASMYWHFLGILWVFLFLFLNYFR